MSASKDKLVIFDTTLRDGEQSPGAAMDKAEKIQIAKMLESLRVDVIEAGFPFASPGDFDAVHSIAKEIKDSTVCGLCRTLDKDIDRCAEAIAPANSKRIHTFIATSPIHMSKKLNMTPDEVVEAAVKGVKRARQYTDDVEFSAEDAGRSEFEFLARIIEAVIDAGAGTINLPDTVGYNVPNQYAGTIKALIETVPNADKAIFSVHCHNDLGLAVANSLEAVMQGARQVECTINGIGERAGNAALEEIVMAIKTRHDLFPCDVGIDTTKIVPCSKLVSAITGFTVQPNKAIVGANAFSHESGIHQDGFLKNRETYEIMRPEAVGLDKNQHIVLGKLSGRNAFVSRLNDLGYRFSNDEEIKEVFERFKNLADKKHQIFDEDLIALVSNTETRAQGAYTLEGLSINTEMGKPAHASVTLRMNDETKQAASEGNGPVDAVFKAIKSLVAHEIRLSRYIVKSVSEGVDAQGQVNVQLQVDDKIVSGQACDTDVVYASACAYIDAINAAA